MCCHAGLVSDAVEGSTEGGWREGQPPLCRPLSLLTPTRHIPCGTLYLSDALWLC